MFCRVAVFCGIIPSRRKPKPCAASLWTAERTLNHSETVRAVSDQGGLRTSWAALWYIEFSIQVRDNMESIRRGRHGNFLERNAKNIGTGNGMKRGAKSTQKLAGKPAIWNPAR